MLKRQRPVSPIPSTSELPPSLPSMDVDHYMRDAKRRRTFAPELDGRLRAAVFTKDGFLDDSDELSVEDDDELPAHENFQGGDRDHIEFCKPSEYTFANSLLHQLHSEQQRRALNPSNPPVYNYSTSFAASSSYHSSLSMPPPPPPERGAIQEFLPVHIQHHSSPGHHRGSNSFSLHNQSQMPDSMELDEAKCVRARYEDNNRLLGSAVLNRLRETRPSQSMDDEKWTRS